MTAVAERPAGIAERLPALVERARRRARETGRAVLVSVVERIPAVDPLDALCRWWGEDPTAERMYWERPAQGVALVGVGSVATFTPGGGARFSSADDLASGLLAGAIVDNPSDGPVGAGPMVMGGFSFEDEGPRSARWRDFPAALLFIPRMQVATAPDGCWLTFNLLVTPGELPDAVTDGSGSGGERAMARRPPKGSGRTADGAVDYTAPLSPDDWRSLVADAVATVHDGGLEKVVVAREVHALAARDIDVVVALRHLRASHPDCYVFGIWRGDGAFIGATPERLVRVDGADVRASTLAGSIARGATPEDDRARAAQLLASEKDRAEHEVVRRTMLEALEEGCDDVTSEAEPSLLTLPQVHHLHTAVRARLRPGHSVLELVGRLHPTPAVGGSPREAALSFLRDHERLDRGWYAAPIGWMQRDAAEFAVALRSAVIRGAEATLYAGCGIVADSDPDREFAESEVKLVSMKLALAAAVGDDAAPGAAAPGPAPSPAATSR